MSHFEGNQVHIAPCTAQIGNHNRMQGFAQLERDFKPRTVVDALCYRAAHQPERRALAFLEDGEQETGQLTYADLDRRVRVIAAHLQNLRAAGERVLLLYPPGIEYVAAFFGCLYAGAIAVPIYPPRPNRTLTRL